MEVAIALLGILVGWALGFGGQLWRDAREGRDAARLVAAELEANRAVLRRLLAGKDPESLPIGLRDTAWTTYGVLLLRLANQEATNEILMAYAMVEAGERTGGLTRTQQKQADAAAELRREADGLPTTPENETVVLDLRRRASEFEREMLTSDLMKTHTESTLMTLEAGLKAARQLAALKGMALVGRGLFGPR